MMETDAANLHVCAVEKKAAVRAKHEAPNPEWRGVVVAEGATAHDASDDLVQVRLFERPTMGSLYLELLRHLGDRVVRQLQRRRRRADLPTRPVVNDGTQQHSALVRCCIANGGANADVCRLRAHLWCGDVRAPMIDMHSLGADEPRVAVDAGAGVPARIRLFRVVYPYGEEVARRTVAQVRRELIAEGGVAIWPHAQAMAIDPDLAVPVDAVELDE